MVPQWFLQYLIRSLMRIRRLTDTMIVHIWSYKVLDVLFSSSMFAAMACMVMMLNLLYVCM